MNGKIESIMNQSVSLLDAEISNIEQVLVLIQDFYQYFDYPYTEPEKRLTLEELFERPTAGRIYYPKHASSKLCTFSARL